MIDQIRIDTKANDAGKSYERVTVWIAGLPFTADLVGDVMPRILDRIAVAAGCAPVLDYRDRE